MFSENVISNNYEHFETTDYTNTKLTNNSRIIVRSGEVCYVTVDGNSQKYTHSRNFYNNHRSLFYTPEVNVTYIKTGPMHIIAHPFSAQIDEPTYGYTVDLNARMNVDFKIISYDQFFRNFIAGNNYKTDEDLKEYIVNRIASCISKKLITSSDVIRCTTNIINEINDISQFSDDGINITGITIYNNKLVGDDKEIVNASKLSEVNSVLAPFWILGRTSGNSNNTSEFIKALPQMVDEAILSGAAARPTRMRNNYNDSSVYCSNCNAPVTPDAYGYCPFCKTKL